ncbi:MAG: diguanylate cyclase [Leptothrix sp. (in: b-proteobacteria)]
MAQSQLDRVDGADSGVAPAGRDKGLRLARRMYLPRCIGLGLGSICVGAGMVQHGAPAWSWSLLMLNALIWPHLAYQWSVRSARPSVREHRNLWLDAAFGGFWVPVMGFNVLPSVLILTMLGMDNLGVGGLRLFLHGLLANALGIALGGAVLGLHVTLESNLHTILACLPFLVAFPLTIGIVTFKQAVQLSEQKKQLYWLSQRDMLSGLFSRAYWERRLDEELIYVHRYGRPATLILADVDHFKRINDAFGHPLGDEVIQSLGAILREQVRECDIAARLGGDEFSILLPQASAHDALVVTLRIQNALAQHSFGTDPHTFTVTMSYGIVELNPQITTRKQWVELADQALYSVKRVKRGGVHVHTATPLND